MEQPVSVTPVTDEPAAPPSRPGSSTHSTPSVAVIPPDRPDLTDQYATKLDRHVVANCGHWIQQERPAEVNALLLGWLSNRR